MPDTSVISMAVGNTLNIREVIRKLMPLYHQPKTQHYVHSILVCVCVGIWQSVHACVRTCMDVSQLVCLWVRVCINVRVGIYGSVCVHNPVYVGACVSVRASVWACLLVGYMVVRVCVCVHMCVRVCVGDGMELTASPGQ